jgi:tetratricopeptide (TPR) repeat protein
VFDYDSDVINFGSFVSQNSFEKQYPGYKIIPEKKSKWVWPLTWAAFAVLLVGVPIAVVKNLSYKVPTPLIVGANKFTLPTVRELALKQSQEKRHDEAAQSFERYFALGGNEADMMAMYAYTLSEMGHKSEALTWSRKASKTDPNSKAAKLIQQALEAK